MTARTDVFYGGLGYGYENSTDRFLYWGSGSPEATITAGIGAVYADTASGTVYSKTSGSGNTGWTALALSGAVSPSVGVSQFFGTGYDGVVALDGSVAAPTWATKSSSAYTLLRDIYPSSLTLTSTAQIVTNGYRIFVSGILDVSAATTSAFVVTAGSIAGGAASGSTGGAASAAPASIVQHGTGNRGGAGGAGGIGAASGSAGSAPGFVAPSTGVIVTSSGGVGGAGDSGTGGAGGLTTLTDAGWLVSRPTEFVARGATAVVGCLAGGGGGGGGGAGGGGSNGGGGGGGGGGNGVLWIGASTLKRATANANVFDVRGGAGGAAENGSGGGGLGGGGGGGAGGGGGLAYIFYQTLSGTASACINASGGNGSAGGNATGGGGAGFGGKGGAGGGSGYILTTNFTTNVTTVTAGYLTAGTAGTAQNNGVGGAGGTGTAYTATL